MEITERELHYRWIDTPSELLALAQVPNPEPPPHPQPNDPPPTAGRRRQRAAGDMAARDPQQPG